MPSHIVSEKKFPKVYAWFSRFQSAVGDAAACAPKPVPMTGDEAVSYLRTIKGTRIPTAHDVVDEEDPQGFAQGSEVEVYPADWGSGHRDSGRLVALAPDEVTMMAEGALDLRIHAPRTGFKVGGIGSDGAKGSTKL